MSDHQGPNYGDHFDRWLFRIVLIAAAAAYFNYGLRF